MRTLVIGDIHGGLKALEQVFERAEVKKTDTLIFLGDYVDGWSESSQVIKELLNLSNFCKCIFIRGNHDKWCQDWLLKGKSNPIWLANGGQATVDSYIKTGYLTEESHKEFFRNLQDYYIDEQNRGFVHGGFVSRKGLGHEKYPSTYYFDRDFWNLALMTHGRYHTMINDEEGMSHYRRFEKHKEIYIGHTPTINWRCKFHYKESTHISIGAPITIPMNRCNVWNLDTGAGWGGKLTIMDINTKEFWQSDSVNELYPDEKGR